MTNEKQQNRKQHKVKDILGILVEIHLQKTEKGDFIEIIVEPYPFPVNFKGRYYYRSGSALQELKGQTLNEFLLRKSGKTWEEALKQQAGFEEISNDAIEEFKAEMADKWRK
jgi:ATP-dependent DNA helicase RecG